MEEIAEVIEHLEPSGSATASRRPIDPRTMAMIRERGITLEVCPTSNLNTRVVVGMGRVPLDLRHVPAQRRAYTINTDGPEMLRTYIRDELSTLGRLGILSLEEQEQSAEWARQASFVQGVSDIPPPRAAARPGQRRQLEREEA